MSEKDDVPRRRLQRLISLLKGDPDHEKATEEALSDLEHEGHIDHDESEMMQGILYLDQTTAREVMVPRTEVAFVDREDGVLDIIKKMLDSGHSRLPVVNSDLDRVLGFIHVKDLLRFWGREAEFRIDEILRRPYPVPETMKLDDLLQEFQKRHEQIALVIDEFGGTSGIVSIEDILEEIVGEIRDEYDKEETKVFFQDETTLIVPGRYDIDNFAENFGVDCPEGNFNTVGGWVFDRVGRVPRAGDSFELDGFSVFVEAASERQLRRVRIVRANPASAAD